MTVTATSYQLKTGNIQVVRVEDLAETKDWLESILSEDWTLTLNTAMGGNLLLSREVNGQQVGSVIYSGSFIAIDEDSNVFKVDADTLNLFFKPAV